jgi:hypothetical protein
MSTLVRVWVVVLAFALAASIFLVEVAARPPTTQALGFIGVVLLAIGQPQMWRRDSWRNLTAEYPEWRNWFSVLGIALLVLSSWRSFSGV